MPAVRLSRRRRSSLAISAFNPIKAGTYGIQSPPHRIVTFAPNVTPGTFVDPECPSPDDSEAASPTSKLFPPSNLPAPAPSRRRVPPGKRRSMGYIPRPPNAFMLFRADFVRQKHVPGSIETNHGSLSKIIGNCWRALPLEEKRVWEVKAKHAKIEHKQMYPEYRFRPVHNKNKEKKEKPATTADDERRCEEVAELLLQGKKGDELAAAVNRLDRLRETPEREPFHYGHRRSSSVPLPDNRYHNIALPSLPFLAQPAARVSTQEDVAMRMMFGQRRASSAQPMHSRSWMQPPPSALSRDESPLPEVDTSLFEPSYLEGGNNFGFHSAPATVPPFNFGDFYNNLPGDPLSPNDLNLGPNDVHISAQDVHLSPLDNMVQHQMFYSGPSRKSFSEMFSHPQLDPNTWLPLNSQSPSSSYTGSPSPSETALPVHAPKPKHVGERFGVWNNNDAPFQQTHDFNNQQPKYNALGYDQSYMQPMDYSQPHAQQMQPCGPMDPNSMHQQYTPNLETLFEPAYGNTDLMGGHGVNGFQYSDIIHDFPNQ
ncbi:hypothetical protein HWV62_15092 [Athelia sp. TMB]|nr:hypothetical protein HWV62_15092 [Athelia sp. TMB]